MRILIFVYSVLITIPLFAQDTTYYNNELDKVKSLSDADYYFLTNYDKSDSNKIEMREYFKTGKIKSYTYYSSHSK